MRVLESAVCAFFLFATSVHGQVVVEDWMVHPGNAAETGNGWIALPNEGHGIDFISGAAPGNTFNKDVVVLQTGEGPTDYIRVLDADTGQFLSEIAMVATDDNFRDHTRIATSDDGFIYVAGFEGTVQEYSLSGAPTHVIVSDWVYSALSPAITGSCRVIEVSGSKANGTLKIFVAKGNTIVIFGNSPALPSTFAYLGRVVVNLTGDIMALTERNGRLYVASVPSPQVQMFEVSYDPFSVSGPELVEDYAGLLKIGFDMNESGNMIAMAVAATLRDEVLIATVDAAGTGFSQVTASSVWDKDNNGRYDGGTVNFKGRGGTSDVCMNLETGDVYGYFPHNEPVAFVSAGAVMKLRMSSAASARDWMMY